MKNSNEKLCLGVITGAHGIRGAVKVKSFTQDPAQLTQYGPLSNEAEDIVYDLNVIGNAKGQLIIKIKGITNRNQAEDLKGTELFINRSKLPEADEDEFYHADLVGLKALDEDGDLYGVVKALFDFGAGDILEIQRYDGKSVMHPFTIEVVPTIDIEAGHIVVIPPSEVSERDKDNEDSAIDDSGSDKMSNES